MWRLIIIIIIIMMGDHGANDTRRAVLVCVFTLLLMQNYQPAARRGEGCGGRGGDGTEGGG